MNLLTALQHSGLWSQSPLAIVATIIVDLAFLVVAIAVIADFRNYYRQSRKVIGSDRSFVETGSMTAFFVAYYLVIRFRLLEVPGPAVLRTGMVVVGLGAVVLGVFVNVYGRAVLKSSWANQIRIYEGQRLLTTGPFSLVRHPLYASLIWIFVGGSLIYSNALSLVITLGIFVPMMLVRAGKEDALLLAAFGGEFEAYRSRTGMFFPRVWR